MNNRGTLVVTAYGHDRIIDKFSINLFVDETEKYCEAINSLELKNCSWITANRISENVQYPLEIFLPVRFSDIILKLDDRAMQKILRIIDFNALLQFAVYQAFH